MAKQKILQGQGDWTEYKQRGLSAAFYVNLSIFQNWLKRNSWSKARYFHFDLNCGSGHNEESNCIGSPLAFLRSAADTGCSRFFAGFVDEDRQAIEKLLVRDQLHDDRCFCYQGDNASMIPMIPRIIKSHGDNPKHAIGTVLSDPNGSSVPIDGLEWLSRECPKMDFFINWNSARFKGDRLHPGFGGVDRPTLIDTIQRLNKNYWLIREPRGKQQWTLLLGRNYGVNDHKDKGFHHLDSPKGQEILYRCHFTNEEWKKHISLNQLNLSL